MSHPARHDHECRVSRRNGGFTLVEVVLALGVLAILAIVALPSLSNSSGPYQVTQEARRIHSKIVEARARSMAERRSYRVAFSAGTFYEMQYKAGGTWHDVGVPDTLAAGVSFTVAGGTDGEVEFGNAGRAVAARSIVVDNGVHDQEIQILASGMALWNANP